MYNTYVKEIIDNFFFISFFFLICSHFLEVVFKKKFVLKKIIFFFILIITFTPLSQILLLKLENSHLNDFKKINAMKNILILSGNNDFITKDYQPKNIDTFLRLHFAKNINKDNKNFYFTGINNKELINKEDIKSSIKNFLKVKNLQFELNSRNTYENILFSKKKFFLNNDEIAIITSSFHAKRVMLVCNKLLINAAVFGVNKRVVKINFFSLSNWEYLSIFLKEMLGTLYYKYKGYV